MVSVNIVVGVVDGVGVVVVVVDGVDVVVGVVDGVDFIVVVILFIEGLEEEPKESVGCCLFMSKKEKERSSFEFDLILIVDLISKI